jgi:hypothetical protein
MTSPISAELGLESPTSTQRIALEPQMIVLVTAPGVSNGEIRAIAELARRTRIKRTGGGR